MRSADPTKVAFDLIAGNAPEHRRRLDTFWRKYAVRFEEVDGKGGIVLNANIGRVQYTRKDLQVMWLTGFSLRRSIELFAAAVVLQTLTGTPSSSVLTLDDKLDEIEYPYKERIRAVTALIRADDSPSRKTSWTTSRHGEPREGLSRMMIAGRPLCADPRSTVV